MSLTTNAEYPNIKDNIGNYFIVDWIINPNDESINSEIVKRYFDF